MHFMGVEEIFFFQEEGQADIYTRRMALLKGNLSYSGKQKYICIYDTAIPLWVIVPKETHPHAHGKQLRHCLWWWWEGMVKDIWIPITGGCR